MLWEKSNFPACPGAGASSNDGDMRSTATTAFGIKWDFLAVVSNCLTHGNTTGFGRTNQSSPRFCSEYYTAGEHFHCCSHSVLILSRRPRRQLFLQFAGSHLHENFQNLQNNPSHAQDLLLEQLSMAVYS